MIDRLHHVHITIPPGAEAEARRFYCDVLGLREVSKPDSLKGRGGFWLEVGDGQSVHIGIEGSIDRRATRAHIALQVSDLAEVRADLAINGIAAEDAMPIPGFRRFHCRDPFGNFLEFIQPIL